MLAFRRSVQNSRTMRRTRTGLPLTLLCRGILGVGILMPTLAMANLGTAGRSFQRSDRIVSTSVFHWFGANDGQLSGPWRPIEGRENWTGDVAFWQGQIKQMMAANIDVLYVHLFNHVHEQKRVNLFNALGQLRAQGYDVPKVAPFLDPPLTWFDSRIDVATAAGKQAFADQYIRFYSQYYSVNTDKHADSYIATIDGKLHLVTWHVFANLDNIGSLTRNDLTSRLAAAFGDKHPMFNNGINMVTTALNPPTLTFADEKVPLFEINQYYRDVTYNNLRSAQLKAGYWDQNVRNPGDQLKRDGGVHYRTAWEQAVAARGTLRRVYIESWNEYDEGSGIYAANPGPPYIAPGSANTNTDVWSTTNDPFEYIKTTADGARRFNDVPDRDARILWDNFPIKMRPGETRTVQVIVRNQGDLSWTAAQNYKFGQQEFLPGETMFGPGRYLLDDTANEIPFYGGVFRGRPVTFDIQITAPQTLGTYQTHWGMLQEHVTWFGQVLQQTITVTNNPSSDWKSLGGDWNDSANWYNGIPNAVGAEAVITGLPGPPRTVYTDAPVVLGTLRLDNPSTCVIAGSGSLTLQAGGSTPALVEVSRGEHKINLPLTIASNTTLSVATDTALKISDPVTILPGKTLSQSGSGTVIFESIVRVLESAQLSLSGAGRLHIHRMSLATDARLDLNHSIATFDMAPQQIRTYLGQGRIISSLSDEQHRLGYATSDSQQTIVGLAWAGDVDLSGFVDFADLQVLAAHWQSTNAVWTEGDLDYDGLVGLADLMLLAGNWRESSDAFYAALAELGLPAVAVPEPAAAVVVAGIGWGLLGPRRQPRPRGTVLYVSVRRNR